MKNLQPKLVNNSIYNELGRRWYEAEDDPVALLRAENRTRNPWILKTIDNHFGKKTCQILDVGCGAGFLTNFLSLAGYEVTGLDASLESLKIAQSFDDTAKVIYKQGDAMKLPFANESFDVVCAMDFIEHIEQPQLLVQELSRVLKPGGLFFFHTFNRNPWSWLVVIKGVEWFVKNTPRDLHVLRLFRKPQELRQWCECYGLSLEVLRGMAPCIFSWAFLRMIFMGKVSEDFKFKFISSTAVAYTGYARKN